MLGRRILNDVVLIQERFIEWVNEHEGIHWVPMIQMANEFKERNPPKVGAKMPKS